MAIIPVHKSLLITTQFETLSPLEQRWHLWTLEEEGISRVFQLFVRSSQEAIQQGKSFRSYCVARKIFQRRYQQILLGRSERILSNEDSDHLSVETYKKFKKEHWDNDFLRSDQIKFLELFTTRINILNLPIFRLLLEDLKQHVRLGIKKEVFVTLFLINEIVATYTLPKDLQQNIQKFLEEIIKYSEQPMTKTLAQEGLALLQGELKKEPVLEMAEKCSAIMASRKKNFRIKFILILCLIIFIFFLLTIIKK